MSATKQRIILAASVILGLGYFLGHLLLSIHKDLTAALIP